METPHLPSGPTMGPNLRQLSSQVEELAAQVSLLNLRVQELERRERALVDRVNPLIDLHPELRLTEPAEGAPRDPAAVGA